MPESSIQYRAALVAPAVAPDRILLARELRGWTQTELVAAASDAFTTAALSQLEQGRTRPSVNTLMAIADATGCPVEFFVRRPLDADQPGFFRSLKSTSARQRRQHLARARLLHDFVVALEDHVALPELRIPKLRLQIDDGRFVESAAQVVRRAWDLDDGPIPNVVRELERHGAVVVRAANFTREVDAFSVWYQGRPIIVLGSEKGVTARSRFDAAHELGHLVLHADQDAGNSDTERQAHAFAAAFLMPESTIRGELPATADWSVLMRLKARWRVSIAALLRRARTLDIMNEHRYTNAVKAMSARGWRITEPGDDVLGALEQPVLIDRALHQLHSLGLDVDAIAAEAALPAADLHTLIRATRDPRPGIRL